MDILSEGLTYEYGSLIAAGASLVQNQYIHQKELEKARERHVLEIDLAKEQHKKSLLEAKRSYLLEIFYDLEQHFQQLNADLIASGNESERDMFDQRNQNFQTIILASSVMFSGLSTAIVDGNLPSATAEWLVVSFALSTALSFFFLFICVVICIELVIRSSNFMYRRARKHAHNLKKAIRETKELMHELNDLQDTSSTQPSQEAPLSADEDENTQSNRPAKDAENVRASITVVKKRIIAMDNDRLEEEWRKHEGIIQKFLLKREMVNDRIAVVDHKAESSGKFKAHSKMSFQEFWRTSCRFWERVAIIFFYLGTLNLLLCIMVFMWAVFINKYKDQVAASLAVSLIGAALVIGSVGIALLRRQTFLRKERRVDVERPDSEPQRLVSVPTSTSSTSLSSLPWSDENTCCGCC